MSATPTGWHAVPCPYCGVRIGECCEGPSGPAPTHHRRKVLAGWEPNRHEGPYAEPSQAESEGQLRLP